MSAYFGQQDCVYNVYKCRTKYLVSYHKKESSTFSLVLILNIIHDRHLHLSHPLNDYTACPLADHSHSLRLKRALNIINSTGAPWFNIVSPASRHVPNI